MRHKKIILLTVILLIGGCADKSSNFAEQVSDKDKKLLSNTKVIGYGYLKNGITLTHVGVKKYWYMSNSVGSPRHDESFVKDEIERVCITEGGFYPDYRISSKLLPRNVPQYKSYFSTEIASYLVAKKFNLKSFLDAIKGSGLIEEQLKRLKILQTYPTFRKTTKLNGGNIRLNSSPIQELTQEEVNILLSKKSSLLKKQKILVKHDAKQIKNIKNPNEELQKLAVKNNVYIYDDILHPTEWVKYYVKNMFNSIYKCSGYIIAEKYPSQGSCPTGNPLNKANAGAAEWNRIRGFE